MQHSIGVKGVKKVSAASDALPHLPFAVPWNSEGPLGAKAMLKICLGIEKAEGTAMKYLPVSGNVNQHKRITQDNVAD